MPFTYYLSFSSFFSDWQIHSHVVNFLRMYNPYIHDKGIKLFANKVLFLALLLTSIQLLKYNVFFFDLKVQQWSFHWHPAVDHTCGRARSEPDRGGHCYFCGTWLESHEGSTGIYTFHKLFPFGVALSRWFAIITLGLPKNRDKCSLRETFLFLFITTPATQFSFSNLWIGSKYLWISVFFPTLINMYCMCM